MLINIRNLNLSFGERPIFQDAQLTIAQGDRIGLIGLNGQGKSTLFHVLCGSVTPDQSVPPFIYDKTNEKCDIMLIPQELNINDYANLGIENYYLVFYPKLLELHEKLKLEPASEKLLTQFEDLGGWDIQNNYLSYLSSFGFESFDGQLKNLSGGERRKIALSVGLSSTAELILWDEPTNHLDIDTIEKFEEELLIARNTYMIITHDRYLLNDTTDKICHIEDGKITSFKGTYQDYLVYLDEREAELRKNLDKHQGKHRRELAWMRQGVKARGTRSKKRVEGFREIEKKIQELKSRRKKVVDLDLVHTGRKSKLLIEIKGGSLRFDDKTILQKLHLTVSKKDKIALIGPNGAGKSSLMKVFQQKLPLSSGSIKTAQQLKIIVFDQNREALDDTQTPVQLVGDGVDHVVLGNGQQKHISSYLSSFLFTSEQLHRPISTLSGGERNRLQLALFMKQAADLWVFDEPTNDLDIETIELLEQELKNYEAAVIIIGHDRAFLDNVCDTTWLIHKQQVEAFEGGYSQVAPFLDALDHGLDVEVKQDKNLRADKARKPAMNMQKLQLLEETITKTEEQLKVVESELAIIDYSQYDRMVQEKIGRLEGSKASLEVQLAKLMSEWEEAQDS